MPRMPSWTTEEGGLIRNSNRHPWMHPLEAVVVRRLLPRQAVALVQQLPFAFTAPWKP